MPSGPVRLALAKVQDRKVKGPQGNKDMDALDAAIKNNESVENDYPVKGKKK